MMRTVAAQSGTRSPSVLSTRSVWVLGSVEMLRRTESRSGKTLKPITKREASAIISWLKEDGDGWELNEYARTEAAAVLKALAIEAGQQEMDL